MRTYDEIFEISAKRHGGADELNSKLGAPKSTDELAAIPDDRWTPEILAIEVPCPQRPVECSRREARDYRTSGHPGNRIGANLDRRMTR